MSDPLVDMSEGARNGARTLIAHAAAADHEAHRGLAASIDDFFLPDAGRLDERTRLAVARLLRALVETVAGEVRGHAARLLRAQRQGAQADALEAARDLLTPLSEAGLLRDEELMAELLGRVRQELLAGAMPAQAPDEPDRPSLINRLAQHPDRVLAQGAMAVLIAESRRRGVPDIGPLPQTDLPAELHHRLVWWIAAALREAGVAAGGSAVALDRALAEAAQRSLAAHDEGDRLEAAAMRLAAAIDADAPELAELMTEALGDRRVALFAALLAHALGVAYPVARDVTLDAGSERLWVALRALEFERAAIARIGVALSEADPRRDLEAFADLLDPIMAIDGAQAREAITRLRLPAEFRTAIVALERRAP
jgi:hypothetical protein